VIRRVLIGMIAAALVVTLSAAALVGVWVHRASQPGREAVLFQVGVGESLIQVVDRLALEGLVGHPRAVVLYGWLRGYDRRIMAGTYSIVPGESAAAILNRMIAGDVFTVSVTVPEGLMVTEIARVLADYVAVDSTAVVAAAHDPMMLARFGVEAPSLEGYLFPDTYPVPWGTSAAELVAMMVRGLDAVFDSTLEARAREIGMSRHEVLTLASIVEAECRLPEERARVSAVYHNRLRRHMRLEADPTVAYAKGGYRGRLFYRDLEIDSPYNTYRNDGLPPGPICSPGEGAILAALYPDTTSTALYFVARGDGGHVFSETLREHLAAVKEARKRRAAAEQLSPSGR